MVIIELLVLILRMYEMLIFMRIILGWVQIDRSNKIIAYLIKITDPVLLPAREIYFKILEKFNVNVPIDLSPILVFVILNFLQKVLISSVM